jgi:hypothetical protein
MPFKNEQIGEIGGLMSNALLCIQVSTYSVGLVSLRTRERLSSVIWTSSIQKLYLQEVK